MGWREEKLSESIEHSHLALAHIDYDVSVPERNEIEIYDRAECLHSVLERTLEEVDTTRSL
jgi:hypothetical protein|tara:strand:- start:716 stop:898 length:183 start_codon:yes stop_codon:yes gene_type:complete